VLKSFSSITIVGWEYTTKFSKTSQIYQHFRNVGTYDKEY